MSALALRGAAAGVIPFAVTVSIYAFGYKRLLARAVECFVEFGAADVDHRIIIAGLMATLHQQASRSQCFGELFFDESGIGATNSL